jgi:hypothetical protein
LASKAAQQAVAVARAEQERALPDANRLKELLAAHAVSKQEYERALAAATASTARLKAAEAEARRAANELDYAVLTKRNARPKPIFTPNPIKNSPSTCGSFPQWQTLSPARFRHDIRWRMTARMPRSAQL